MFDSLFDRSALITDTRACARCDQFSGYPDAQVTAAEWQIELSFCIHLKKQLQRELQDARIVCAGNPAVSA